jgi:hypothetical protein
MTTPEIAELAAQGEREIIGCADKLAQAHTDVSRLQQFSSMLEGNERLRVLLALGSDEANQTTSAMRLVARTALAAAEEHRNASARKLAETKLRVRAQFADFHDAPQDCWTGADWADWKEYGQHNYPKL